MKSPESRGRYAPNPEVLLFFLRNLAHDWLFVENVGKKFFRIPPHDVPPGGGQSPCLDLNFAYQFSSRVVQPQSSFPAPFCPFQPVHGQPKLEGVCLPPGKPGVAVFFAHASVSRQTPPIAPGKLSRFKAPQTCPKRLWPGFPPPPIGLARQPPLPIPPTDFDPSPSRRSRGNVNPLEMAF